MSTSLSRSDLDALKAAMRLTDAQKVQVTSAIKSAATALSNLAERLSSSQPIYSDTSPVGAYFDLKNGAESARQSLQTALRSTDELVTSLAEHQGHYARTWLTEQPTGIAESAVYYYESWKQFVPGVTSEEVTHC